VSVTNIPDDHHIVRHCKNSQYFIHNEKIRPWPEAFHLKPASEKYPAEDSLSGVYYEWFDGPPSEKLQACCHFILISMKRKDALLRLNAGSVRAQGQARSVRLRVLHEPSDDCEPYSAIRGLSQTPDNELCSLLASLSLIEAVDFAAAHG
jgi:hypothetical protein